MPIDGAPHAYHKPQRRKRYTKNVYIIEEQNYVLEFRCGRSFLFSLTQFVDREYAIYHIHTSSILCSKVHFERIRIFHPHASYLKMILCFVCSILAHSLLLYGNLIYRQTDRFVYVCVCGDDDHNAV